MRAGHDQTCLAGQEKFGHCLRERHPFDAQSLGFTLQEIRELIGIAQDARPLSEVAEVARHRIADIEARIEQLQNMRGALLTAVEQCSCGGDLSRCNVLAGLSPEMPGLDDPFETGPGGPS